MNEQERIKFLKSMGYGGSLLNTAMGRGEPMHEQKARDASSSGKERKERVNCMVDKSELLNLHRIFNDAPSNPSPIDTN